MTSRGPLVSYLKVYTANADHLRCWFEGRKKVWLICHGKVQWLRYLIWGRSCRSYASLEALQTHTTALHMYAAQPRL